MDENKLNMEQINVSSGITETTSTSASGKSKSTAIQLGFNVWTHNEIECPGDEVWYKFTPSTTGYYRIYTSGSLDTVGYLYDSNNNLLDDGDDEYSGLNYEITQRLTGGRTYYIKTVAYGNATGNFAIKLTNDIKISSLAIEEENVTVGRFREYQLTPIITPSYASNQNLFWESTDPSVVTVESSTGKITGAGEGWARVCAYAQDGSGKVACCEVTVNVLVDLVRTFPPELTLRVGEVDKLYASVYPPDADEQDYYWVSDDNEVAYVNHKGEVTAVGVGSTKVYALSTVDYSYTTEKCDLTVLPAIPVTGVVMCSGEHTMVTGNIEYFTCDFYPSNATNKNLVWCSTKPDIATVDESTGKVTAVSAGETIITATTEDGGYVTECNLKVINDIVTITKDGMFSNVVFGKGKVWKCNIFEYDTLTDSIQPYDRERAIHNSNIEFTERELGLLYRIDPNGVVHYVKEKSLGENATPTNYLIYRDNIFKEIYGRVPRYFKYENNRVNYYAGITADNRYDFYSEAELIFGMLPRWSWQDIVEIFFDVAVAIMSVYIPAINVVTICYETVKGFFFTEAFLGSTNAAASELLVEAVNVEYREQLGKIFGWGNIIVNLIPSLIDSALPPEIDESQIAIYENAYKNQFYLIKVSNNNQAVYLNEFIEHYNDLFSE